MAGIQITLPAAENGAVLPGAPARFVVKGKRAWAGDWELIPYLQFDGLELAANPGVSRCDLLWRYGSIKREDRTSFAAYRPLDLVGWFVRVELLGDAATGTISTPVFHGVIQPTTLELHGAAAGVAGDQRMAAFGLEHLLDRVAIDRSWCLNSSSLSVVGVDVMPAFNESKRRGIGPVGNRSSATKTSVYGGDDAPSSYVFAGEATAGVWTVRQIVDYLLAWFPPAELEAGRVPMTLAGQVDALDFVLPKVEQRWSTLKGALDALLARQMGLGWCVRVEDDVEDDGTGVLVATGQRVLLHVFTVAEQALSAGDALLPANAEPVRVTLDDLEGLTSATYTIDPNSHFDELYVRGELIKSVFSVSYDDGTLVEGWGLTEQGVFAAAEAEAQASEVYRHVYQRHLIPRDWAWQLGGGAHTANPSVTRYGEVADFASAPARDWGQRLLRQLPVRLVDPGTQDAGTGQADYDDATMPLVVMRQGSDSQLYYQVDSPAADSGLPGAHVRMLDDRLGFQVDFADASIFAGESAAHDYTSIIATVAAETDVRLAARVRVVGPAVTSDPPGRVKVIEVPGAEAVYVAPGTVTGVDAAGALTYYAGNVLPRDDSARIQAVANLARAWYGRTRAAVALTIAGAVFDYQPGQLITTISAATDRLPVGTVVSRVRVEYQGALPVTTIETDWHDLDFAGLT